MFLRIGKNIVDIVKNAFKMSEGLELAMQSSGID